MKKRNIILIGPPGVGKSTVGVLLAKRLSMQFTDTDLVIQAAEGNPLQVILDRDGVDGFIALEEEYIRQLDLNGYVIATGGSVIYGPRGMAHLKELGTVVFLHLPCDELLRRIQDLDSRGVVIPAHQTFQYMYDERLPLYQKYADITIDCTGLSHDQVINRIAQLLG